MSRENTPYNEPMELDLLSEGNLQLPLKLQNIPASTVRPMQGEPTVRSADFIKIEKNLASLGFFTPSHKRISGVKQKVVALSREVNGRRLEARATILPSAQYGLPTTADQRRRRVG